MLSLTRKVNETIHIGDEIVVKVHAVHGNRVKLGIQAPDAVKILRGELLAEPSRFGTDGEPSASAPGDSHAA